MHAAVSAPGFGANPKLRDVVGTTALAGGWLAARASESWAEIWTGMPPASGEPQRMRRAMRATSPAALVAEHLRQAAEPLRHIDYSTDLGAEIGSTRWWRGLALMLALSATALAFWPGFAPPLPPRHLNPVAAPVAPFVPDGFATGAAMDAEAPTQRETGTPRPQIALATTLADGDSYGEMLQKVGVAGADAEQVSTLITTAIPMGEIAPGTSFTIFADAGDAHALQRVEFRTRTDVVVAIERRGASFELGTRGSVTPAAAWLPPVAAALPQEAVPPAPLIVAPRPSAPALVADAGPLRIRGMVGASLYRSARAAGAPAPAVQQYLQTLGAHMDIAEMHPDDTFDMILASPNGRRGIASPARDLVYAGLEHRGKARVALVRWGNGHTAAAQFFDALPAPAQLSPAHVMMPVAGKITSGFGMRFHPILGFTRMHEGIDLSAPYGAPIFAVASGTVSFAGLHGGHGKFVRLEHSGGLGTGYAHMSRIAVAPGTHVHAGQIIGYVGTSGLSTGAHLHYEVYRDGQTVNPMTVRFGSAVRAMPRNIAALRARLAPLLRVKPGGLHSAG